MRTQRAILPAIVLLSALALVACGAKRLKVSAAPVSNAGVSFDLKMVKAKKNRTFVYLTARNQTANPVMVYTGLVGVVGPDGRTVYSSRAKPVFIKPMGSRGVNVGIDGAAPVAKAPGFYVRIDGVCVGNVPVAIPPMAVNQPTVGAGQANTGAFNCAGGAAMAGARTTVVQTPFGNATVHHTGGAAAPPPSDGSIQRYNGPRQRVSGNDLKCAAIPLSAPGISKDLAFIMDEVLLTELQQVGFEAIGPDDINALIGFEKVKDAVGCDDAGCIAEIGNALGVEYLVSGKVAKLENSMVLTLKIINVAETRVVARSSKIADGGENTLPRLVGEGVQELVRTAGL